MGMALRQSSGGNKEARQELVALRRINAHQKRLEKHLKTMRAASMTPPLP
jgi:hypothetical protein